MWLLHRYAVWEEDKDVNILNFIYTIKVKYDNLNGVIIL